MFTKKLLALSCTGFVAHWITVWTGDCLSQLSKFDYEYFKTYYGNMLRLRSSYDYDYEFPELECYGFEDF